VQNIGFHWKNRVTIEHQEDSPTSNKGDYIRSWPLPRILDEISNTDAESFAQSSAPTCTNYVICKSKYVVKFRISVDSIPTCSLVFTIRRPRLTAPGANVSGIRR
jgi:hypothetical protein